MVQTINAILDALRKGQAAPAALPAVTVAPVKPASQVYATVRSQSYGRDYPPFQRRISKKEDISFNGLSRQQVLPLAALAPLLGPLLQQAPQLLQVLADSPVKLLNVLNEAITVLSEISQKSSSVAKIIV
jgi:hypothetical protein